MSRQTREKDPLLVNESGRVVGHHNIIDSGRNRRRHILAGTILVPVAGILVGFLSFLRNNLHQSNDDDHQHMEEMDNIRTVLDILNGELTMSRTVYDGCETTVMFMRHCEQHGPTVTDSDGNEHCSYLGSKRSRYIATLFGNETDSRWPTPSVLYALTPTRKRHLNYREYETLLPLSEKIGVDIGTVEKDSELLAEKFANRVASGDMCDKLVVVCWKHTYMVDLAQHFGCTAKKGCPQLYDEHQFDEVWLLNYMYREHTITDPSVRALGTDENSRQLRHHHHRRKQRGAWSLYGSSAHQGFDQLRFDKEEGRYNYN